MGRPLNKKLFGNKNFPYQDQAVGGPTGDGGEGVRTITVSNSGTLYSQGTTLSIGAPNLAGGVQATISYSINSAGNISVSVTNSGTGYTAAPALTVTKASTVTPTADATSGNLTLTNVSSVAGIYVGMRIDGSPGVQASTYVKSVDTNTITLTNIMTASTTTNGFAFSDQGASFAKTVTLFASTVTQNAIAFSSFLLAKDGGSSAVTGGDIMKQEASRRYLVNNSQGRGQVKLVANVPAAGEMTIIATDTGGATYYVTKLTAHKATLVNISGSPLFADNATAGWTLGSASLGVVSIASN